MSTTPPLRAAIYARDSTDKQRETSIDDQVRGWTRLCEQRGYVQVETYSDAAKSGGTVARPALKRLLDDVKAGRFDVIVLDSLTRLSRHPADLNHLHRLLYFIGVKLVTVDVGYISLLPVGILEQMSDISLEATARETHRTQQGDILREKDSG